MKAHIYKIENLINSHIYVGSSFEVEARKTKHFYLLDKGNHHSIHLQRAYNKYGKENFKFEILEELNNVSIEEVLLKEQFYLDSLNPEYNICKIAGSCIGVKRSKESRDKMVKRFFTKREKCFPLFEDGKSIEEIMTILNYSYACVLRAYKDYCSINNIEFVKRPTGFKVLDTRDDVIYDSIKEVSIKFGYVFNTLRIQLNDIVENKTPFKLIVSFDKENKPVLKDYFTKNKSKKEHVKNIPVNMFDKNGKFIKSFISASEAALYTKSTPGNILKCCRNIKGHKTIKGYIFKFKNKEHENFK